MSTRWAPRLPGFIPYRASVPRRGAVTLFLATYLGIPVSTTHTITGAIIGVGAARKVAAVRWNVASNVVFAWIVTLPATALFGSVFYELGSFLF